MDSLRNIWKGTKRGVCSIIAQARELEMIMQTEVSSERQPEPAGKVQEKEIEGKKFKLGLSLVESY